jgi:hypothetical protein
MKLLMAIMSTLVVMSTLVFVGAFQACTNQVEDTTSTTDADTAQLVDTPAATEEDVLVTDAIIILPSDVFDEVTTEELDVVVVDIDIIEFSEEDTADMFD